MQTLRDPSAKSGNKNKAPWKRLLGWIVGGFAVALLLVMVSAQVVSMFAPHLLARPTVHNVEVLETGPEGARVQLFDQAAWLPPNEGVAVEVGDPVTVEFRYRGSRGEREFSIDKWYATENSEK